MQAFPILPALDTAFKMADVWKIQKRISRPLFPFLLSLLFLLPALDFAKAETSPLINITLPRETNRVFLQRCNSKLNESFDSVAIPTFLQNLLDLTESDSTRLSNYLQQRYGENLYVFETVPATNSTDSSEFDCKPGMRQVELSVLDDYYNDDDTSSVTVEEYPPEDLILVQRILANGYLTIVDDNTNTTYSVPPELYCLSELSAASLKGKACIPSNSTIEAPLIRRCHRNFGQKNFILDHPSLDEKVDVNFTEPWAQDELDLFQDTRISNRIIESVNHPVYYHRKLGCEYQVAVSDPNVMLNGKYDGYYDIRIQSDGSVEVRESGFDPWTTISDKLDGRFCIDTFVTSEDENSTVVLPEHRRVLIVCDMSELHDTMGFSTSETQEILVFTYKILLPFALVLLAAIFVLYIFIWSDQKVHGRTCCMFAISNFMYFLALAFAIFEVFGRRTESCLINAVILHFSLLSMYFWMAVMNFDVWSTINSMVAVSQRSKGNKRFVVYCFVAFGIPSAVVAVALGLHFSFLIDNETIHLPQYGYVYCGIRNVLHVYLYYTLIPVSIAFCATMVFGGLTIWTLIKWKRDTQKIKNASTKSACSQWSVVLKLMFLMGIPWGLEIIYFVVFQETVAGWLGFCISVYHCIKPVFLFWMFLCKREIKDQLCNRSTLLSSVFSTILSDKSGGGTSRGGGASTSMPSTSGAHSNATVVTQFGGLKRISKLFYK